MRYQILIPILLHRSNKLDMELQYSVRGLLTFELLSRGNYTVVATEMY